MARSSISAPCGSLRKTNQMRPNLQRLGSFAKVANFVEPGMLSHGLAPSVMATEPRKERERYGRQAFMVAKGRLYRVIGPHIRLGPPFPCSRVTRWPRYIRQHVVISTHMFYAFQVKLECSQATEFPTPKPLDKLCRFAGLSALFPFFSAGK